MLLLFWRAGAATVTVAEFHGGGRASAVGVRGALGQAALEAQARRAIVPASARTNAAVLRGVGREAAAGARGALGAVVLLGEGRAAAPGGRAALAVVVLLGEGRAVSSAVSLRFQIAVPVGDIAVGSWTTHLGGTTSLYDEINEASPDAADFIQSSLSPPVSDDVVLRLGPLEAPGTTGNHRLAYQYQKDLTGGDRIDLVVRLYDAGGTVLVAEQAHVDIDAITDGELALTPLEAAAIPPADYETGLILVFRALKV